VDDLDLNEDCMIFFLIKILRIFYDNNLDKIATNTQINMFDVKICGRAGNIIDKDFTDFY
tara:strand:- start:6537 stop:6716 length:180 start_codon:yes stop_codon:yes gene_type:complete